MTTIAELKQKTVVPVVISDEDGCITFVNEEFKRVFGWRSEQIIGRPLTAIIPEHLHDAHNLGFSRFLTTEKPTLLGQAISLRVVGEDGREFDAEHKIVAEKVHGRWTFGATIRPLFCL